MAAPVDDSRIVVPFMPSLLHLARVKVALPLLQHNFGDRTLKKAFTEIQGANSTESDEDSEEVDDVKYNRAKQILLYIPGHLREKVLEAVSGMKIAVREYRHEMQCDLHLEYERLTALYWRSDGTLDYNRIAEELVLNGNIDIQKRFEIACSYCFEKRIQDLWKEMEASGETENCVSGFNPMTRFWVRWIRDGAKVPWIQAARENLGPPHVLFSRPKPRFSSFFPLLQPEDRQKFLETLNYASFDDIRLCLYSSTVEEEKEFLEKCVFRVLAIHLHWPLQSLFLETIEKAWEYIKAVDYWRLCVRLLFLLDYIEMKDFDYYELFSEFWYRSPNHLKVIAKEDAHLNRRIEACLKKTARKREMEKKRKAVNAEPERKDETDEIIYLCNMNAKYTSVD